MRRRRARLEPKEPLRKAAPGGAGLRRLGFAAAVGIVVAACGCARNPVRDSVAKGLRYQASQSGEAAGEKTVSQSSRSLAGSSWATILLYPANRFVDLFDLARFGLNVGPGLGLDAQATDLLRVAAIHDSSVGVGFQGLRRLPVCVRSRSDFALGPIRTPPLSPLGWHGQFWDMGLEVYGLLAGAHVYVNPKEILDFLGGWMLFDPMSDDLETAF